MTVTVKRDTIEALILAGAFDSLHSNRRALLWALDDLIALRGEEGAHTLIGMDPEQFERVIHEYTKEGAIEDFHAMEKFWLEYHTLGLTPSCHIMSHIREEMQKRKVLSTAEFRQAKNGAKVWVGGLVIRPHRPPTRSGTRVLFVTLEDEFGMAPVTFFERTYRKWGHVPFNDPLIAVHGRVQRQVRGVTLIADKAVPIPWKRLCPQEDESTEAKRDEAIESRALGWLSPFPRR
ncbi:MAG: hypothetical protein AMXMBFR61_27630 [Fimbriimonadales bacterium]